MSSVSGSSSALPKKVSLGPQVRKLDSENGKRLRNSRLLRASSDQSQQQAAQPKRAFKSRASASALHLGKSACSIPEHDDMHKRNEKLKDILKKEKESIQGIKDEAEEREGALIREKTKMQKIIDEMIKEKSKSAQKHAEELNLIKLKQNEQIGQIEKSHHRQINDIINKNGNIIQEKEKAIENLKQQISCLMKGQSSTRQAQIEELRKKLIDAAREANELKNEILKLRKPSGKSNDPRPIQIGVCMNCIVMQQALSMANAALKSKMRELKRIEEVGKGIRLGLEMNDLALDSLDKNIND
jgi:hypothetical protein